MKNFLSHHVFLLLVWGMLPASYSATAHEEKSGNASNQLIAVQENRPAESPIRPRMPERTAIECMYEAASESLSFQFFEEMGGVTVTVVNTTTGEMFFDCCSSTPGTCRVALSGDAGAYSIFLEDDFGRTYSGSFTL